MSNIRQDIKNALKNTLTGTPGVRAIFTAKQRLTQNQQTPCVTIHLPDFRDSLITPTVPFGKRRIEVTALLEVLMVDVNPIPETGEAQFDDLLDELDKKLRADFTLGGVVAASAIKHLETHVPQPQMVEGQTIFRVAVKKFDITVNVVGLNDMGEYIYSV